MPMKKPISTAPTDGSKVTIVWMDDRGVENRSLGQYRSTDRLNGIAGQWDAADEGWWVFVDDDTQKRVRPDAWIEAGDDSD